jgi:hypothetical protein
MQDAPKFSQIEILWFENNPSGSTGKRECVLHFIGGSLRRKLLLFIYRKSIGTLE